MALTIKEAALLISSLGKKYLNCDVTPVFDDSFPEGDIGRVSVNKRAEEILKWTPTISFKKGLERLFSWILVKETKCIN